MVLMPTSLSWCRFPLSPYPWYLLRSTRPLSSPPPLCKHRQRIHTLYNPLYHSPWYLLGSTFLLSSPPPLCKHRQSIHTLHNPLYHSPLEGLDFGYLELDLEGLNFVEVVLFGLVGLRRVGWNLLEVLETQVPLVELEEFGNGQVDGMLIVISVYVDDLMITAAIPIDDLIHCLWAEGILGELDTDEKAYDMGFTMIESLKDVCLLEGHKKDCVKKHDVVHDVAKWISNTFGDKNTWRNLR
ncbi:hypothetical protein BC332_20620 [Capsicum chinense]|nr:hypothetical protein BC332_20620 [Capsicum chinense]